MSTVFLSCAQVKKEDISRKVASENSEAINEHFDYVTKNKNFWSPSQDFSQQELEKVNDMIRDELKLTQFYTEIKGKAPVLRNKMPRVADCKIKIYDFSKKQEEENKIVILLEIYDHNNSSSQIKNRVFSTAEDLIKIKKSERYPRAIRTVLYRPHGAPNLSNDLRIFNGPNERFVNITTNTPITFDKEGATCEF